MFVHVKQGSANRGSWPKFGSWNNSNIYFKFAVLS